MLFSYWLNLRTIFQKSIIFLIIWGVTPTSRQTQWNFQNKKDYNFWVMWPGLRNIVAIRGRRKNVYFSKIALWTRLHGWEYLETFLCGIRNKPEYLGRWLRCHEFVFKCSQRGPPKDEDLLFLSFWTNFRNKWGVATNISFIFIVLL